MEKTILTFTAPSGAYSKSKNFEAFAIKITFCIMEADRWPDQDGIDFHNLRTRWGVILRSKSETPL